MISQGREIARRLLIAVGGLIAGLGLLIAVVSFFESQGRGRTDALLGMALAIGGFFAWRATVNWVLLYSPRKPGSPDNAAP